MSFESVFEIISNFEYSFLKVLATYVYYASGRVLTSLVELKYSLTIFDIIRYKCTKIIDFLGK